MKIKEIRLRQIISEEIKKMYKQDGTGPHGIGLGPGSGKGCDKEKDVKIEARSNTKNPGKFFTMPDEVKQIKDRTWKVYKGEMDRKDYNRYTEEYFNTDKLRIKYGSLSDYLDTKIKK